MIKFAGSPMNREKLANHRKAMEQRGIQETSLTRVSNNHNAQSHNYPHFDKTLLD